MEKMKTFRFIDFPVYHEGRSLYKEIVTITKRFPREYWELADQIRRSALSVCLNIAEGSAKQSDKDFNRYVENSLGSINETAAGLDICLYCSLIAQFDCDMLIQKCEKIARQLGGFSKKLKSLK